MYIFQNPTFTGSELDYYKMVAEAAEAIADENEELKQVSCDYLHMYIILCIYTIQCKQQI